MKNFMVFCLLTAITISASGQSKELSMSLSSYNVDIALQTDAGSTEVTEWRDVAKLFNGGLGYYIPIYTPHSEVGIGVNAAVTLGASYQSTSSHAIYADLGLPVTATFRYGAGSTREAYSPVGIGLGAGYRLNGVLVPDGDPFYIQEDPVVLTMFKPYLFVELVLDYQKRDRSFFDNFKIQFAIQPSHTKTGYSPDMESDISGKMSYYSISFIKFNALD